MKRKICHVKIDVSCEASVDFHDMSQNTLSPLRAALTMRFAKSTQHDTSKMLRLSRKMASEVSKVLRLPRKMQHIFWKCSKSIAPAAQNDFGHVLKHVGMPRLPRKTTWPRLLTCQKSHVIATFPIGTATLRPRRPQANGCGRLQTVADAKSRVTRTRVNPQTPKCKTRTLRYAFGKNIGDCGKELNRDGKWDAMAINQTLLALAMDEPNDTNKPITNQVRMIEHWWDGIGRWKA